MTQPEKRFKVGACTASVFSNEVETPDGPKILKRVSLQRVYKTKEGDFKYAAGNLKPGDIPKAILALQKAFDYLTTKEEANRNPGDPQG